ncbi:MAG: hypothetical protein ACYTG7_12885 [Planctomycetota bacterium]|jgi:hypothetical protein
MLSKSLFTFAAVIIFTVLFAAPQAAAQVSILDACFFPTICVRLRPEASSSGPPNQLCWGLPILEDGWTERQECMGPVGDDLEPESYLFKISSENYVVFVEKIKLVPNLNGTGQVYDIVEDLFLIRCNPATAANPSGEDIPITAVPQMLILDDVTFPPITLSPQEGPAEFLCAVMVPIDEIVAFFGPNLPIRLDWFACADLDSNGTFYGQPPSPDLDLNGCPDSCLEVFVPGAFLPRQGLDEKGAGLLNFLQNWFILGLTAIEVFEPQPTSYIPALLPGMSSGESHNTRPWCFTIDG